jgi:nucleotide sugar dehydrogenase
MPFLPDCKDLKVAVVGFGYVGACLAATLADRGLDVVGLDTDTRLIDELARHHCRFSEPGLADLIFRGIASGRLRVTADGAELSNADVVLVTVGTPIRDDGSLSDAQLRGACLELGRRLRAGQLIIVKSTVPPGTTRKVVLPLLERSGLTGEADFGLAFTPERLAEGTALEELRAFPMVSGGLGAASALEAADFWRRALGVNVIEVDSLEAAEIVKLADNWWIDLNIALGNELAKFCTPYGVDVLDVIKAANTIPKGKGNVNILLPSVGVGGSCLTKDPWMVWYSARQHGVEIVTAPAGRKVNAGMPEYTAQLIIDGLLERGKEPADAKVAVLGIAFKNNSGDLRATPTLGTVQTLQKAGADVRIFDPLIDDDQAREMFGITPSAGVMEAVKDADCIAVLALHQELEDIEFATLPVADRCFVLDGRAYYSKDTIAALRRHGYGYLGIGR